MRVIGVLKGKGSHVATVGPDQTLLVAAAELGQRRIGALVVTGPDGSVVGIVSERDIVASIAAGGAGSLDRPVSEVMTVDVITCSSNDTMEQLMSVMTAQRIRHLPVVDDGALVGIVSIGDVVKRRVGEIEDEAKALGDYITQGR
jgi:CBS domain-containing protein